uniref:F-box domain-containing protein n=1 Tax=Tetradesmus obliquus TaxID=3088 RepID=A0A383W8V2_TETOB|eukprot:jgi/Sobl393_1/15799/SZX73602.1
MKRENQGHAPGVEGATENAVMEVSPGLAIALEHPAVSSSPQLLCAVARSCRAWRQAVQQCRACHTAVVFKREKLLQQLHSFAQWLPKHAALVKSITATAAINNRGLLEREQFPLATAQQLLQQALQAAAGVADAGCDAAGADAAAAAQPASSDVGSYNSTQHDQQQQQQQHGWRLASFSSDLPGVSTLLQLLPSHSLAHLHLVLEEPADLSQLARLSSLQQLHLQGNHFMGSKLQDGCLAVVVQLSQLTSLRLSGMWWGIKKQLQQLLAQPLPLRQLVADFMDKAVDVRQALPSLAHLTQLTDLYIRGSGMPGGAGAALPAQLQSLHLGQCTNLAPVLALKQLQRLTLWPGFAKQQQVLELASLPAVQELHLNYQGSLAAAAAAPTWVLLPQLRGLDVELSQYDVETEITAAPSKQRALPIISGAAAAIQLTSLQLHSIVCATPLPICGSLAGLRGLKHLTLKGLRLPPGDALALTALTGLTGLVLRYMHGMGDITAITPEAIALTCSLNHLQHLDLNSCRIDLSNPAFLASVGQLKQLTYLSLECNSGLTQQCLMQLTGLSRLQQLKIDKYASVTGLGLDAFWAAVRRQ